MAQVCNRTCIVLSSVYALLWILFGVFLLFMFTDIHVPKFFDINKGTEIKSTPQLLDDHSLGINYGTLGNNLPNPYNITAKIKSMNIGKVKIFAPDHTILSALADSGLKVVVGVTNDNIEALASSTGEADRWVEENIAVHYPQTDIVTIMVGNEVFRQSNLQSIWGLVVPAMQNIHDSLEKRGWSDKMKLSTTVTLEVLQAPYPPFSLPSRANFRRDLLQPVMLPLLNFLRSTDSYLFMNVHPIYSYWQNYPRIPLNYALLEDSSRIYDWRHVYTNILFAQLDAMNSAMRKWGFGNVHIAISETGWPTKGDANQLGAPSIRNAQTYNQRLVKKVLSGGTPMYPDRFIPTFIFALFNENEKAGPTSERNWGLLDSNGDPMYRIDLTGKNVYYDSS